MSFLLNSGMKHWMGLKRLFSRVRFTGIPRIGLALGGGGVRGLAHVGVLAVLEREKIPVHAMAGSSMGAIIAAAHTLSPEFNKEQLVQLLEELGASIPHKLKNTQPDKPEKDSVAERLRQFMYVERFILNTVSGWGMLPEGLADKPLEKLTPGKRLEEAPIPIAVVAVDLISGKKVVFKEGPALLALKASSAIPGFLPPVPHNGMLLVDGAIVDVVPTDVVREMGVEVVIAVDVDQEGKQVEISNGLEAFLRAVELCSLHHKRHHLEMAQVVIHPQFPLPVQTFDVSKAQLCIDAGIRATEAVLPKIRKLLQMKS